MPVKTPTITSMTTIKKDRLNDETAADVIIVSSDDSMVYFVETDGFTTLGKTQTQDVPLCLTSIGVYDSEFIVYFSGRASNKIYKLQRKSQSHEIVSNPMEISLGNTQHASYGIIDIKLVERNLVILTSKKMKLISGKIIKTVNFSGKKSDDGKNVLARTLDKIKINNTELIAVSFSDASVQFFRFFENELNNVGEYTDLAGKSVDVLRFLSYGREENCMITVIDNELDVKILKRTAKLGKVGGAKSIGAELQEKDKLESDLEVPIPTQTQLFVELISQQEKYAVVHKEWIKIKLKTAEEFLKAQNLRLIQPELAVEAVEEDSNKTNVEKINPQKNPHNTNSGRFSAYIDILGLGNPYFDLVVHIKNLGKTPLDSMFLTFDYDDAIYEIDDPTGITQRVYPGEKGSGSVYKTRVKMVSEVAGVTDVVRGYFTSQKNDRLLQQIQIEMPPAENLFF